MAAGDVQSRQLPSLPSPTLTNPDMLLPNETPQSAVASPPRTSRPPSISYLYDRTEEQEGDGLPASQQRTPKKTLGLMSRKRAFRRSDNGEMGQTFHDDIARTAVQRHADAPLTSSPSVFPERTSSRLRVVPAPIERKTSTASSSIESIDLENLPLYRFDGEESDIGTLDYDGSGTVTPTLEDSFPWPEASEKRAAYAAERSSAELSRRAELILANAKKRLNLMDENLRGARALTTENLQRAASLEMFNSPYSKRFLGGGSVDISPARESAAGHARNRSAAVILDVPTRPQTAMARDSVPFALDTQEREVSDSAAWTAHNLRGTRSQELPRASRHISRPLLGRSPDSSLEALQEGVTSPSFRQSRGLSSSPGTSEIHQQMQQLKGRISSLREKAREDSIRRRSLTRRPSAFTDAESSDDKTTIDANNDTQVVVGTLEAPHAPLTSRWSADSSVKRQSYLPSPIKGVFIEEEESDEAEVTPSTHSAHTDWRPIGRPHMRQVSQSTTVPLHEPEIDAVSAEGLIVDSPGLSSNSFDSYSGSGSEDLKDSTSPVAHEDREDAFDYHNFFLHSAMGQPARESDTESEDSNDTARGPMLNAETFPVLEEPETPENLRKIERSIHMRQMSSNSVSTIDSETSAKSFATATEGLRSGRQSPLKKGGSDGADSGIGLQRNKTSGHKKQMSHQIAAQVRTIGAPPESIAVQALIEPDQKPLGLRDKALVFMLVESLRSACVKLQANELDPSDGLVLRRRLEEARKVLDGLSPVVS